MNANQVMRDVMRELDVEMPHPTLRPFVEHVVDAVVTHLYESEAVDSRVCDGCGIAEMRCPRCEPLPAHECEACLAMLTCPSCGAGDE